MSFNLFKCALIVCGALAALLAAPTAADTEKHSSKPKLHRHTATHVAWETNAYFVETDTGIVLIDGQLLKSDARTLAAMIKHTGKPLAGLILTHPHIDHFAGIPTLRDELGPFPVYGTQAAAGAMEEVHQQMLQNYPMPNQFNEAIEDRLIKPDVYVTDGQAVSLAGLDFLIHDLGPSDSPSNLMIYQKDLDVLFAGDSFYPHQHYYLGEGHFDGAQKHLAFILDTYNEGTRILGGHANSAPAGMARDQLVYIKSILEAARSAMADSANLDEQGNLTREARAEAIKGLMDRYRYYYDFGYGSGTMLTWYVFAAENYLKQQK